jgi:pimeloyl-ACP methyl ester carboxylesterase
MKDAMTKTLFLPGAGGSASFWKPVAERAGVDGVFLDGVFLSWPGLGNEPAHSSVNGVDDLVSMVLDRMSEPVHIVAQSMGGAIAIEAALAAPEKVDRLVLTVTSGGVPVSDLGGSDWRADYFHAFPRAARWIAEPVADVSARMTSIEAPTLLIWGDSDPISPIAVGKQLLTLLPHASLHIIPGAGHDVARTHAGSVARLIAQHLSAS